MVAVGSVALASGYALVFISNQEFPIWLALIFGIATGGGIGLIATGIAMRLTTEDYLLVALAIAEIVRRLAFHSDSITGGAYGKQLVSTFGAQGLARFYAPGLIAALAVCLVSWWFRTPAGLRWRIVGNARQAAVLGGIDPRVAESWAGFALGVLAGVAGAVYVLGLRYIHPDDLGLTLGLASLAVALSARPQRLFRDMCFLSFLLFGLRDVLGLIPLGSSWKFAAHDLVVGILLLVAAGRLEKSASAC